MPPTWPCFVCSDDLQLSSWSCFCRCCSHQWKEPCAHRGHRQEPILFLWAQQRGRQEQPRALYKRRFCSMKLISHLQSYLYRTLITGDATDVVRCTQRAYHATGVYCLRNILRGSKPTPLSNWCSFSGWGNIIIACRRSTFTLAWQEHSRYEASCLHAHILPQSLQLHPFVLLRELSALT